MSKKNKVLLVRIIIALFCFITLLVVDGTVGFPEKPAFLKPFLFLIPFLTAGYDVLLKAGKNIAHGEVFDENFLMIVAGIGAYVTGEYSEAAAVMIFYQVGELFQSYAVGKSRESISALMNICPEVAYVETAEGISEEDPDDVEVGSIIVVRPGERIPIDSVVVEGESFLDTTALTGESVPRRVSLGDHVISGCINGGGTLRCRTEKAFEDSTVSKVLELVENASGRKSRAENFITKFAKFYTPIVTVGAVLLAVIPSAITGNWAEWIKRACTFLVISCPCALVISVPLGFFGGIGAASRKGILIKGSNFFEVLNNLDTVCFDKTGTLTKGVFEVTGVYPADKAALIGTGIDASAVGAAGEVTIAEADGKVTAADTCGKTSLIVEADGKVTAADTCGKTSPIAEADGKVAANTGETDSEKGQILHILEVAALCESYSTHPIAASIVKAYEGYGKADGDKGKADISRVTDVTELSGRGVKALVDGRNAYVGNIKLMSEQNIAVKTVEIPGKTVCYVAYDGKCLGAIAISDVIKEGAAAGLAELKNSGVKRCIMLTGDLKTAAEAVVRELEADAANLKAGNVSAIAVPGENTGAKTSVSETEKVSDTADLKAESDATLSGESGSTGRVPLIDEIKAELLPQDKVATVEDIINSMESGRSLGFVGDGINDAPVLMRADVGFAMGSLGSDSAIEAADVVIMDDDLRKIGIAGKIAGKTIRIVRQNIVFAIGVKLLVLILGALGLVGMWAAVFADVGVAVLAILNSMRTLSQ